MRDGTRIQITIKNQVDGAGRRAIVRQQPIHLKQLSQNFDKRDYHVACRRVRRVEEDARNASVRVSRLLAA